MIETRLNNNRMEYKRVCEHCDDVKWIQYNGFIRTSCASCNLALGLSNISIKTDHTIPKQDENKNRSMIDEWLSKNNPTIIEPTQQAKQISNINVEVIEEKIEKSTTQIISEKFKKYFASNKPIIHKLKWRFYDCNPYLIVNRLTYPYRREELDMKKLLKHFRKESTNRRRRFRNELRKHGITTLTKCEPC